MSLRDKMLAVIDDVNGSVAEREELVEMIAIALLTRKNLFVLGEPGQAKSYAINLFRQHITGARQFERLLSKQSDEEQLFGRVDLCRKRRTISELWRWSLSLTSRKPVATDGQISPARRLSSCAGS